MVLPSITGTECQHRKPARVFSDINLPPILSQDADSEKLGNIWNKLRKNEIKLRRCSQSGEKEQKWSLNRALSRLALQNHVMDTNPVQLTGRDFHFPWTVTGNTTRCNPLKKESMKKAKQRCDGSALKSPKETRNNYSAQSKLEKHPGKTQDDFKPDYFTRQKAVKKIFRKPEPLQNISSRITVGWCGRQDRARYTRLELSYLFSVFGPIRSIHFQSPCHAEIEFTWLASACQAVRAARVCLPGKALIFRQWAHATWQEQVWCKKDSRSGGTFG